MGKNVAVFVDVANIFYAAKAAGVDIDYVTLLKSASAGRDLVRAYAYTGLDPDNENQRNFHDFLRRSNYKVVSKDIRKYGDGKIKANLDIELVVDMMKTARNLDIAIVVSGDGDFAPAIRAVQEQGVRVEVVSFRGNTSSDLMEVADLFTDITQLARVERGSRSGRRVAEDGDDLSMTEVPDKQTEGTGVGRGRGGRGGRGRGRFGEAEPVPVSAARGRGRGRSTSVAASTGVRSGGDAEGGLVALPGERLSRSGGSLTEADLAAAEVFRLDDVDDDEAADALAAADRDGDGTLQREDDGARRRRRRGGRGRGRGGRGREDALAATEATDRGDPGEPIEIPGPMTIDVLDEAEIEAEAEADELEDQAAALALATRGPRATPFGSVWDSQLGTSAGPTAANLTPLRDDEDFDEPEIPEYLIAEQRRGAPIGSGRGQGGPVRGGPRGGRAAYQSAMDRERFGRGGGGGINRYPDVSGRTGAVSGGGGGATGSEANRGRAPRQDRGPVRRDGRPVGPSPSPSPSPRAPSTASSSEPWSEVPPELEAMLRSQVSQKPTERAPSARTLDDRATEAVEPAVDATSSAEVAEKAAPKRRTTRKTAVSPESEATVSPVVNAVEAPVPKRRATRKAVSATGEAEAPADAKATARPAPRRRAVTAAAEGTDKPAPRSRSSRTSANAASDAMVPAADDEAAEKRAPTRRTPTRKPSASGSTESA